jgi:hypothetical protein
MLRDYRKDALNNYNHVSAAQKWGTVEDESERCFEKHGALHFLPLRYTAAEIHETDNDTG